MLKKFLSNQDGHGWLGKGLSENAGLSGQEVGDM